MHLSLFLPAKVPAPVSFILLTLIIIVTPHGVHAQFSSSIPSPSHSPNSSYSSDVKWFAYLLGMSVFQHPPLSLLTNVTAGLAGLLLLVCCCACCGPITAPRSYVRDIERQPAAPLAQQQGQRAAPPAPPPYAHTKEEIAGIEPPHEVEPNWDEPSPPPYYPVGRFPSRKRETLTFFHCGRHCASRFLVSKATSASPISCNSEGSHDADLNPMASLDLIEGWKNEGKEDGCWFMSAIGYFEADTAQCKHEELC